MPCRTTWLPVVVATVLGLAVACGPQMARGATQRKPLPSLADVRETALRHFELLQDYQPGDVISRSEVEPLFVHLWQMGWTVVDRKSILHHVPSDHDFLVKQLRTPAGRKLMREIGKSPNVYDRLDRLSWLRRGRQIVHELIGRPGAAEAVKSLATTTGRKKAGKLISRTIKVGADFHKPTGRLYTVEMLLARLEKSYKAAKSHSAAAEH